MLRHLRLTEAVTGTMTPEISADRSLGLGLGFVCHLSRKAFMHAPCSRLACAAGVLSRCNVVLGRRPDEAVCQRGPTF